ncbi:MAG: hypothetical protein KatS3mg110_3718 [Pirellulaceae bacterium]|nr:MAG: hypothetical protein KatS3mg110_3718 [Pirellulaceae bacterium]
MKNFGFGSRTAERWRVPPSDFRYEWILPYDGSLTADAGASAWQLPLRAKLKIVTHRF